MIDLVPEADEALSITPAVWDFNGELDSEKFAEMLSSNMILHKGVGLSANQVGVPFQVFSMLMNGETPVTCFNPKILEESEETVFMKEGCLSYPHLWLNIHRPKSITVSYRTERGELIHENLEGFEARIFHHEMDHMNGKNFTERVSKTLLREARKKQRVLVRKYGKTIE